MWEGKEIMWALWVSAMWAKLKELCPMFFYRILLPCSNLITCVWNLFIQTHMKLGCLLTSIFGCATKYFFRVSSFMVEYFILVEVLPNHTSWIKGGAKGQAEFRSRFILKHSSKARPGQQKASERVPRPVQGLPKPSRTAEADYMKLGKNTFGMSDCQDLTSLFTKPTYED